MDQTIRDIYGYFIDSGITLRRDSSELYWFGYRGQACHPGIDTVGSHWDIDVFATKYTLI